MTLNSRQQSLLLNLIKTEKNINKALYSASDYWQPKTLKIINQIKKNGIEKFRGDFSGVGTSYCDNIVTDVRNENDFRFGKILSYILKVFPLNILFNQQVNLTKRYFYDNLKLKESFYKESNYIKQLIKDYDVSDSTEFGCVDKINIEGSFYSCNYLETIHIINKLSSVFELKKIQSFFEIGGGFGSNIHLLIKNFSNIKKIIYLDIVPNLFLGTEYLRYFYGDSVIDFQETSKKSKIEFSENDKLEIICIPPWEIEKINSKFDHFHNSASFVEMSDKIIENYAFYIKRGLNKEGNLSLLSYDTFDLKTTINPSLLTKYFNHSFQTFEQEKLLRNNKTIFFVSKTKK